MTGLLDPVKGYRATWNSVISSDKKIYYISISWNRGSIKIEWPWRNELKLTVTLDKIAYIVEAKIPNLAKDRVKFDIAGVKYDGMTVLTRNASVTKTVIEPPGLGHKLETTVTEDRNHFDFDFSVDSVSQLKFLFNRESTPDAHIIDGSLTLNFGSFQAVTFNVSFNTEKNDWSKFKVNFDIMEASGTIISLRGNTLDSPYQFTISAPYLFQLINAPQNPLTVTINPGGSVLTNNKLTNTQILINGDFATATITSREEWNSRDFFLSNKVHVNLNGTYTKLDMALDLVVNREVKEIQIKLTAVGETTNLGNFSISRDLKIRLDEATNKNILDMTGYAEFSAESLASYSPIQSELKLSFDDDVPFTDFSGKLVEVFGGKSYVLFDILNQLNLDGWMDGDFD